MHYRKPRKIGAARSWVPRLDVHISLRPSQAKNTSQHAHQSVLNIRQLRTGGGAHSVDHYQRVHDVPGRGEVIRSSIDGVGEAIVRASSAFAQQRIGDRPVVVVNNSDGSGRGGRCNVCRSGDNSFAVGFDVAAVYVFVKMSDLRCGEGSTCNAGPGAEGGGHKSIGLRAGKNRAQVSLVGEVLHGPVCPDQGLAFNSGIVAGARYESWASGAAGNGTADKKNGKEQNSRAHGHSSRAARMARSS